MNKKSRENKPNKQDFESVRNRMLKHDSQLRKDKRTLLKEEERNIENLNSKQLENILYKIHNCYQINDVENAILSMKLLSKSVENSIDILFNGQLFQPMFSYLNNETYTENIVSCLNSLIEIIDQSFGSISSILNIDLLSILTKLFNFDDTVRFSIFHLLSKISNHGKTSCTFVIEMNFVELCQSLSNECTTNSRQIVCQIIRNIFCYNPEGCNHISTNLVHILKKHIVDSEPKCIIDIIWSFLYILEESLMIADDFLDKNIMILFIQLLRNKNELIILPIMKILNFVYFDSPTIKSISLENDIITILLSIFPISNCDCWKEIIFFLSNIASGESEDVITLRNSGISFWLLYSITNGTHRIQTETIYFYKNISREENADQIDFWISKDVVLSFSKLLRPSNVDMNCIILDTLICALTYTPNFDEMSGIINDCNVINAIEESNFHMVDCGYKLYKNLISVLSGEDLSENVDDEKMVFEF